MFQLRSRMIIYNDNLTIEGSYFMSKLVTLDIIYAATNILV